MRIALLSDTRIARLRPEYQPLYRARLDRLIASVNAAKVDAVLIAGNLTQNGRRDEVAEFKAQIKRFTAPVRYVYGERDVGGKRYPGQENPITAARIAPLEASLGPSFWAEALAGARVVAVNSSLFGSGLPQERVQWAFLGILLARPAATPTLLLTHYPPYLSSEGEPGGSAANVEPKPRARLLKLLARGGVRAVLSGSLPRIPPNRRKGIPLISAPSTAAAPGPASPQPPLQGWTQVTAAPDGEVHFSLNLIMG